jgi:hypothetical protein
MEGQLGVSTSRGWCVQAACSAGEGVSTPHAHPGERGTGRACMSAPPLPAASSLPAHVQRRKVSVLLYAVMKPSGLGVDLPPAHRPFT